MEPITGVATVTDPAQNQGGAQKSTLENLDANIANALNLQAEPSPGAPLATPVPPPAAAEPAKIEAEAEAKMTRLSQDNSQLRTTLIKLGIDPDSQTAEQLRNGFISFDDILRSRQPIAPQQPSIAPAPRVPLNQKIQSLRTTLTGQDGKNVTAEEYRQTMTQALDVIGDLAEANQNIYKVQEKNELQNLVTQTLTATKQVFGSSVALKVPEPVREIGERLFIGATDLGVGELAAQVGREQAFTPGAYRHVATKLAPDFDKFVQAIFQAGQQAAVTNINRGLPPGAAVVPLAPGTGRGSPPPPKPKGTFSFDNLDRNVDAFLASTQAQI